MPKTNVLVPLVQKYMEADPALAARNLESLESQHVTSLLKKLPASLTVRILFFASDAVVAEVLFDLPPEHIRAFVDQTENQRTLNILGRLPAEKHQEFFQQLSDKKKKQIQDLLTFPEGSAGRIMSTKFIAFRESITVRETTKKLREAVKKDASLSYVYVLDSEDHLAGVLNMRDLLLAQDSALLSSVMRKNVFSLHSFQDRETVTHELTTRKFFSAPVVDSENRMLGIVKAEQLLTGVQEEATEDLQKMFGAGGDEKAFSPMLYSLKQRLPWLHINLATAFLAASVVALFESVIAKLTILAVFLPVVAGQGGNAGAQSLAVVMRGLVMREIPAHKVKALLWKESWIGLINGVIIGLVTAAIAWLWKGNAYLGLVIGLGMIVNLFAAGIAGASIPLVMKALGLDPAQASNIILTTITDVVGFFAFLGFAFIFMDQLL